jgi:hypothetical protein
MPIGPIPQNIANLVDTQAYKIGDNNQIDRSGGKGIFTFKSTQAVKNQAVLTNVVNQLKTAFGNNSFNPSDLSLPPAVAKGSRAITGADIKALANTARQLVAAQQAVRNLNTVLHNANPTAGGVMAALKNATTGFPADQQGAIIKQAIGMLGSRVQTSLRALVMSPEMKDLHSIANTIGNISDTGMKDHRPLEATIADVKPLFGMLVDGVRTAQASILNGLQHGQFVQSVLPDDFSFQGGAKLFDNLSNATKAAFTDLGVNIQQFQTDVRTSLRASLAHDGTGNFLRSNDLGTNAVRSMNRPGVTASLPAIVTALMPHLTDEVLLNIRQKDGRNAILDSPQGREFQQHMANLITQNPMKRELEAAIRLLRSEVKPNTGVEGHAAKMLSGCAGTTLLPGFGPLSTPEYKTNNPDKFYLSLLMQQAINVRLRPAETDENGTVTRPADPLYTALTQLQGFNELVAPPQDNIEI